MSIVRLTANISSEVFAALVEIATKNGTTKTEALRRAISHQKFFNDAVAKGEKILLRSPDGQYREVILF